MEAFGNNPSLLASMPLISLVVPWSTAQLHLFKNNITASRNTVLTDLVEADYSGYSSKLVTWAVVGVNAGGDVEIVGTTAPFRPTGATIGNGIYGFFLTDAGNTDLLLVGLFDGAPLPMADVTNSIVPILEYILRDLGMSTVVS